MKEQINFKELLINFMKDEIKIIISCTEEIGPGKIIEVKDDFIMLEVKQHITHIPINKIDWIWENKIRRKR